ncbi:hypothetical protein K8R30_02175 [archaeon]|nr:hypothetical protein [archaeon]
MATEEEIYLSISLPNYKTSKLNTLMAQTDLLQILKKLHKLKVLSRRKCDLKKSLQKQITSTLIQIDSIQNKLPTSKVPKTIQKRKKIEKKETFSKRSTIEKELQLINEKLRELNS